MLRIVDTLLRGINARATEAVTDQFAVELIEQKIRDAQASFRAAKLTLAGLIQKQRVEQRALETLAGRIADLEERAARALDAGREDLGLTAAEAIADLENERAARKRTLEAMESRIERLRHSLDRANRRIIDLRQGAISAKAVDRERRAQRGLGHATRAGSTHIDEAEALVARVLGADDPFEKDEILREIDAGLDGSDIAERMAGEGFGKAMRVTPDDILDRLRARNTSKE